MKKTLIILGISTLFMSPSMAYIFENQTSDVETLRAQGFSESTLEIVDWAKARNNDMSTHYAQRYSKKKHRFLGKVYDEAKVYFDPIQDDGNFGDHHIEFSNTWQGNETFYSTQKKKNNQVENL